MQFKPDEMRQRFAELSAQAEKIKGKSGPMRAKRDETVNKAREVENKLNAEIKKVEAGLYEIDQERAMISRALNGKTGIPKEAEAPAE